MFHPVPGEHVYSICPRISCEFYIVRMIADYERTSKIHSKVPFRLLEEIGIGLDALAAIRPFVGTHVNIRNSYISIGWRLAAAWSH